jgi:hypothetical protein
MDNALFRSFFDVSGINQIVCAAGSCNCMNNQPVEGSNHRCMSCGLKYHSEVTCVVGRLDVFLRDKEGFDYQMLSLYGQEKFVQYSGDLSALTICYSCQ